MSILVGGVMCNVLLFVISYRLKKYGYQAWISIVFHLELEGFFHIWINIYYLIFHFIFYLFQFVFLFVCTP